MENYTIWNNRTKRHTSTQNKQDITAHEVGIMDKLGEEFYDANHVIGFF